jgi:hypothetical protein
VLSIPIMSLVLTGGTMLGNVKKFKCLWVWIPPE